MFNNLDASVFDGSNLFYENEFEEILSKVTFCYSLMRKEVENLVKDENSIRDILVNNYINNPNLKRLLKFEYFVFSEVIETNTTGRTDIRFQHPNTFYNQEEYYIIECKRLDAKNVNGTTGLNAKYIKNGIQRFTSNFYSSFYRVNGMIGFVTANINIPNNITAINKILFNSFPSIQTTKEITKDTFIDNFDYQYHSEHINSRNEKLKIYHLMYDLS